MNEPTAATRSDPRDPAPGAKTAIAGELGGALVLLERLRQDLTRARDTLRVLREAREVRVARTLPRPTSESERRGQPWFRRRRGVGGGSTDGGVDRDPGELLLEFAGRLETAAQLARQIDDSLRRADARAEPVARPDAASPSDSSRVPTNSAGVSVPDSAPTAGIATPTLAAANVISLAGRLIKDRTDPTRERAARLAFRVRNQVYRLRGERDLASILSRYPGRPIVVFPSMVDWHIPIYQRPQHIALQLARRGFLYFFCTYNTSHDRVVGFEELSEGCFLTNQLALLSSMRRTKIFHTYSTDLTWDKSGALARDLAFFKSQTAAGNGFLYEYVDEIHRDIALQEIPEQVWERHAGILADERISVVATATRLYDEVLKHRHRNCGLVTNGVDYSHFAVPRPKSPPAELNAVVARGRPIVGYFGALAAWFDYRLLMTLARQRDLEIVLIGYDYDGSQGRSGIARFPNIHFIGPVPYKRLPEYAAWFDVSTIPFRLNAVTESTSPIKLFEYMALGTPIVTTDLPECRKYQSVLIGRDQDEYLARIDEALARRSDAAYQRLLRSEALANTWEAKAEMIARLLKDSTSRGVCR